VREFSVNFYLRGVDKQFAHRTLPDAPSVGDVCVFNEKRYRVWQVEWCLDADASPIGFTRINVDMEPKK